MSAEAPGGNAVPVEAAACGKGEGQVYGRAYFRKGSACRKMVGYPRSAAWLALRGRTDVDLLVQGCTARWRQRTASCFGSTRAQYEWLPPFGDSLEERSLACADIAALLLALGLIGRSGGVERSAPF